MTRVLVIEDDPSIRQVIVFALGDEGFVVDEAIDGQDALESVARRHPDLILLDMQMPGMDGKTFMKHYRERYNHQAPIIMLTAATDGARQRAEVNAEGYVPKPFDLDILLERVTTLSQKVSGDP